MCKDIKKTLFFLVGGLLPLSMQPKLMNMKVLKFGGTSVGSAESIKNVKNIIRSQEGSMIIVVSAMSGVTNKLVVLDQSTKAKNASKTEILLHEIRDKHLDLIEDLYEDPEAKSAVIFNFINLFSELRETLKEEESEEKSSKIITFGETFLSYIFSEYLCTEDVNNQLFDAKEFMHIDNVENPEIETVRSLLLNQFEKYDLPEIVVTQGFIRVKQKGKISTLKRGGSDYTATIIGAAIDAAEVQIWTDIDGFHNNDPRYVENTLPLAHLSFEEAAELAYFGAKILHPQTVSPVKDRKIPIYLKNTFTPNAPGTKISADISRKGLKAISAKDGITAIKIKSNRMLMAHGFLKKIFDIFDRYETAIDMITTSEIAISLTIDNDERLELILGELQEYGEISVDKEHSIICVVGEGVINDKDTFKLFELLNDIPVRMISYGGSNNNISLLVQTCHKIQALRQLNYKLFKEKVLAEA